MKKKKLLPRLKSYHMVHRIQGIDCDIMKEMKKQKLLYFYSILFLYAMQDAHESCCFIDEHKQKKNM